MKTVIKIIRTKLFRISIPTTFHPNDRNLTDRKHGANLKHPPVHRNAQFEIALRKSTLNRSMYSWHIRRRSRIESRESRGRERDVSRCCVAHPIYTQVGISRRMINLPSRFEPPSYRHGYFNILKFHPKRAVYQNLHHKLRAATPPIPLANPPDILHPPRCRDSPMP